MAAASDPATRLDAGNVAWRVIWRAAYVVARRVGPLVRLFAALGTPGYADSIVELRLVGRISGRPRPVLITLIEDGGNWYVGHPNGPRPWLANLAAADSVAIRLPYGGSIEMRGVPLALGKERDRVIR